MSTATVTQREPTLHWVLATGLTNPIVDLCADRACTQPLSVTATVLNDHSARPSALLPPGWVFWRVRATAGTGTVTSATWQMFVTRRLIWGTNNPDGSGGSTFDVNGDGYTDLLIGAGDGNAAHIFLGNATGTSLTRLDLENPDGGSVGCDNSGTCFGGTVGNIGDVNGDGFADFAIHSWTTPGQNAGNVHIYLGGVSPDVSEWNGATASKRIDLIHQTSRLGSIAAIGDVNGDGYGDFISQGTRQHAAGLFYGTASPSAACWTGTAPPAAIQLVSPDDSYSSYQMFGPAAGVGDVNADGFADFLIGAPSSAANVHFSFAHLYYGGASTGPATWNGGGASKRVDLATKSPGEDYGGSFGISVAGAGDVNGDGYSDFLIGAPAGPAYRGGHAYLYFGAANRATSDWNDSLQDAYRVDLSPAVSDGENNYGYTVSGAGDIDGDGLADFVVGSADQHNSMVQGTARVYLGYNNGTSYYYWTKDGAPNRFDLVTPDGPTGMFGTILGAGGDVDRNGYSDFLICAPSANMCHLDFGSATPSAVNWNGTTAPARLDLVGPEGGMFGGAAN